MGTPKEAAGDIMIDSRFRDAPHSCLRHCAEGYRQAWLVSRPLHRISLVVALGSSANAIKAL